MTQPKANILVVGDTPYDAEAAGTLCDEYAAIREKREAPGVFQPFGHDGQSNFVLLGSVEHERSSAQGRHR